MAKPASLNPTHDQFFFMCQPNVAHVANDTLKCFVLSMCVCVYRIYGEGVKQFMYIYIIDETRAELVPRV